MQITIDVAGLRRLENGLARLQRQLPVAIARGLNEGGDKMRTQVQHALQKQTGLVRYGSVTSRTRTARAFPAQGDVTTTSKGSPIGRGMNYQLFVTGKPTKMFEFKTRVTKGPGGGVTAWLWGVAHRFPRSFEGSGKISGRLLMRVKETRHPLRSFNGPNLAEEAVKGQSAAAFYATANAEVPDAVVKHIAKLL